MPTPSRNSAWTTETHWGFAFAKPNTSPWFNPGFFFLPARLARWRALPVRSSSRLRHSRSADGAASYNGIGPVSSDRIGSDGLRSPVGTSPPRTREAPKCQALSCGRAHRKWVRLSSLTPVGSGRSSRRRSRVPARRGAARYGVRLESLTYTGRRGSARAEPVARSSATPVEPGPICPLSVGFARTGRSRDPLFLYRSRRRRSPGRLDANPMAGGKSAIRGGHRGRASQKKLAGFEKSSDVMAKKVL